MLSANRVDLGFYVFKFSNFTPPESTQNIAPMEFVAKVQVGFRPLSTPRPSEDTLDLARKMDEEVGGLVLLCNKLIILIFQVIYISRYIYSMV